MQRSSSFEDNMRACDENARAIDNEVRKAKKNMADCPDCALPTFHDGSSDKVYCANCNKYYSLEMDKAKGKKAVKIQPRKNMAFKVSIALGAFVICALIISLSIYSIVSEERELISIQDVSDIRGLEVKQKVDPDAMSRGELNEYMAESLDAEWEGKLRQKETFYKCLYIIEEDISLVDLARNSSAGSVAGFYDPDTKKLYVIGEEHTDQYMNQILSHEFTHALQDQHYDLNTFMETGSYDSEIARLAGIEGDAMLTMEKWTEDNLDDTEIALMTIESLAEMVSVMQDIRENGGYSNSILSTMGYFPYSDGMEFVKKVYEDDGWAGVNSLFSDKPPLSTEHILFYDKYVEYEPVDVITYECPIEGMDLQFTSGAGMKLLSEMIGTSVSSLDGWGGDKFYYYENGDEFLSVFKSSWDSEDDNENFGSKYNRYLNRQGTAASTPGVLEIRDNYSYISSEGTETTVYYSSSMGVIESLM